MNAKLRILLGAVCLTGLVAMVFLACQMTFERWQDKAAVDSGAAGLMGYQVGAFFLLVCAVLFWLGFQLFGSKPRHKTSDTD